ncbi:MAG TPA: hypothetical protein VJT72_10655 [Pseudonocardiaceae bacterium]|nr:hypothetical protein [Pseudonocardiaceae bacterium]
MAWVTSNADGTEHAVTDEQMTAGRADGSGMYVAQCGLRFVAAPMVTPALRRCTDCLLLTPAPPHHRAGPPRGGLLARWTGRLLRLLRTPVAVSPHPQGGGPASLDESHSAVTS